MDRRYHLFGVCVQYPLSIQLILLLPYIRRHYVPQLKASSVYLLLIAGFIRALAKTRS